MADPSYLDRLAKELTAEGKLIEAGWIGFRLAAMPPNAGKAQLTNTRAAFFAGAQHLFSSIMSILDPGEEPTDADMEKMSQIAAELKGFIERYMAENVPTEGSA